MEYLTRLDSTVFKSGIFEMLLNDEPKKCSNMMGMEVTEEEPEVLDRALELAYSRAVLRTEAQGPFGAGQTVPAETLLFRVLLRFFQVFRLLRGSFGGCALQASTF